MSNRSRYYVVCIFLLHLDFVSEAVRTSNSFECSYDICLVKRKDEQMTVGCVVNCKYGMELVFSGTCNEGFKLVSTWFGRINRRLGFREVQLIEVGIAYYFTGYILRPMSARDDVIPWNRNVADNGKHTATSLNGKAVCYDSGGSVELKMSDSAYRLDVNSGNGEINWIAEDSTKEKNHPAVLDFLKMNLSLDLRLFRSCADIVHAVKIGHKSDLSPGILERTAVVRRDACSGRTLSVNWVDIWANWTKYCEIYEQFERDPGFLITVHGYEIGSRIPKLVGLFAFVFGAFTLLTLFCCMTLKQRQSLFKDLRGESSLRLKGEYGDGVCEGER